MRMTTREPATPMKKSQARTVRVPWARASTSTGYREQEAGYRGGEQGSGLRAQGTGNRAQGTGNRAQGTGHRGTPAVVRHGRLGVAVPHICGNSADMGHPAENRERGTGASEEQRLGRRKLLPRGVAMWGRRAVEP